MNDVNLVIETLKEDIIGALQNSKLPISVIYYLMDNIYREVEDEYKFTIQQAYKKQLQEQQEAIEKEQEETKEE